MRIYCTDYRRRQWHPTPVLLPGKSHRWRSLVGCCPQGRTESDTTEATQHLAARLFCYCCLCFVNETDQLNVTLEYEEFWLLYKRSYWVKIILLICFFLINTVRKLCCLITEQWVRQCGYLEAEHPDCRHITTKEEKGNLQNTGFGSLKRKCPQPESLHPLPVCSNCTPHQGMQRACCV